MGRAEREFGAIIQIGDILISEDVVSEFFACDYAVCMGACCIVGDSGAPLEEDEKESLKRDYPHFCSLMREQGREAVEQKGFFEKDRDGDTVTPLVEGSEECAYCHFGPSGEALCAIEKSGRRKPRSCSLYPIRVTPLSGGGKALNLHRRDICRPAFEKGRKDHMRVYEFLKTPLSETYGEEFYAALEAAATHLGYPPQGRK